jgi:hypothetical protein
LNDNGGEGGEAGGGGSGGFGGGGGGGGYGGLRGGSIEGKKNAALDGSGGSGGPGGFGGGGGGGNSAGEGGTSGAGGLGGFGGGGGGAGGQGDTIASSGEGGFGGGDGGTEGGNSQGGGGAGFGGALFVRSGSVLITDSAFTENSAAGGEGAVNGLGKGGAIFAVHVVDNPNGNDAQMPDPLATIEGCGNSFEGNAATDFDAPDNDSDNPDTFGTSREALIDACGSEPGPSVVEIPALGRFGAWLMAGLLALGGWLGLRRRVSA